MKWCVWITGYPGSYSAVEADTVEDAIVRGAREQKASHHAETITVNARRWDGFRDCITSRDCTITRTGEIRWRGSLERWMPR